MSNDLTDNPLIVDTSAATVLVTNHIKVKGVRWVAETTSAGDVAEVKDADGNVKWASVVAVAANHSEADLIEEWWDGLIVSELDSGTLYVYLS